MSEIKKSFADCNIESFFSNPWFGDDPALVTLRQYIEHDLHASLTDIEKLSVNHTFTPAPPLPDGPVSWDVLLEHHDYDDPMSADITLEFCGGKTVRLTYDHQSNVIVGVNVK